METFWVVYKRLLGLARVLLAVVLLMVTTTVVTDCPVEARSTKKSSSKKRSTSKKRTSKKRSSRSSRKRSKRSHKSSHRSRSRKASKPRAPKYAYPYDFFMMDAPAFDRTPISQDKSSEIMRQFVRGQAGHHPAATMVQAGIFKYHALKGGIFHRREPVKYIIMHSTETGNPTSSACLISTPLRLKVSVASRISRSSPSTTRSLVVTPPEPQSGWSSRTRRIAP